MGENRTLVYGDAPHFIIQYPNAIFRVVNKLIENKEIGRCSYGFDESQESLVLGKDIRETPTNGLSLLTSFFFRERDNFIRVFFDSRSESFKQGKYIFLFIINGNDY